MVADRFEEHVTDYFDCTADWCDSWIYCGNYSFCLLTDWKAEIIKCHNKGLSEYYQRNTKYGTASDF